MVYIIAEVGVNHNGDKENAMKMIKIAKECGANAVKFQTFKTELLVDKSAKKTKYQMDNDSREENAMEMLKRLELKDDDYLDMINLCKEIGIDFISTPFDLESAHFLIKLGLKTIKVGSGDLTNYQLLKFIVEKGNINTLIVSTGMSNLDEVVDTVNFIKGLKKDIDLKILHCVSNYPTKYNEINMKCLSLLREKTNLDIGFSDHTIDNLAAICAVSMGALIIEKHFTLDKKMEGPDHIASLEPDELKNYINDIRSTEIIMGEKIKMCQESEIETRKLVRRSFFLLNDKNIDDEIVENDLICKRPLDDGIEGNKLNMIIGKKLKVKKRIGEQLLNKDLY